MAGRGSRFHYALNSRRWHAARRAALKRDGYRCRNCHRPGRLQVHHVRPLRDGGEPYLLSNLETYCRDCHINRHKRDSVPPDRLKWRGLMRQLF